MAFGVKTNERPGTRAVVRNVRSSAYKAREVLNIIRGESYGRASEILEFSDRGIAEVVRKCLDSAVANAENNDGIPAEELYISACYSDEGPTLKRWRPRARGRATRIRKRTCHITIIVSRYTPEQLAEMRSRAASGTSSANAAASRRDRVAKSRATAAARAEAEEHDHDHDHEGPDHDAVSGDDAPLSASEVVDSDADGSVNADDASPFGEGSAKAGSEGEAPSDEFVIKGNADSMLYHPPESPFYGRTVAEVWFTTAEAAEAAGFQLPPSMRDEVDTAADETASDGLDGSSGDDADEVETASDGPDGSSGDNKDEEE